MEESAWKYLQKLKYKLATRTWTVLGVYSTTELHPSLVAKTWKERLNLMPRDYSDTYKNMCCMQKQTHIVWRARRTQVIYLCSVNKTKKCHQRLSCFMKWFSTMPLFIIDKAALTLSMFSMKIYVLISIFTSKHKISVSFLWWGHCLSNISLSS